MKGFTVINKNDSEIFSYVTKGKELLWINLEKKPFGTIGDSLTFTPQDVSEASERLSRFAPVIKKCFPETEKMDGIIESPLVEISKMRKCLEEEYGVDNTGRLFLKMDSHLAVSGSVKARGGIYEVLKHTEDLAFEAGILASTSDDYTKLLSDEARTFFSDHNVQVGSTGNLGLSIGIAAAAIGYEAIVHMSCDAKQWKKDLLRKRGVTVCEYEGDYALAVENGRKQSETDPKSYFVDDENSRDLFCGYAVAGERLRAQLDSMNIAVDEEHPLYVYIPCGVGGAPGGITYGLKLVFGDNVHVFFSEPTQAPCMLVGLLSGLGSKVCVQDYGLSGKTEADGLAVARCSELVSKTVRHLIDGEATIADGNLNTFVKRLWENEGIFIEPSAAAAFQPYVMNMYRVSKLNGAHALSPTEAGNQELTELRLNDVHSLRPTETGKQELTELRLNDVHSLRPTEAGNQELWESKLNGTHIIWATGGSMVPDTEKKLILS